MYKYNGHLIACFYSLDNVAVHSSNSGNTVVFEGNVVRRLTDGIYATCHVMIESAQEKKIFIAMGVTYDVYKVFIVANPAKLDAMVDFQIKVGRYRAFKISRWLMRD